MWSSFASLKRLSMVSTLAQLVSTSVAGTRGLTKSSRQGDCYWKGDMLLWRSTHVTKIWSLPIGSACTGENEGLIVILLRR